MIDAQEIIKLLRLEPHPAEGGFFREVYRTHETVPATALPQRYAGKRSFSTAIYYLLTPNSYSALHRVASDEAFHFYLGDPVEMLQLHPDGHGTWTTIGSDLGAGMRPLVVVPAGVWQGSRLAPGGRFALLGNTVAPGFEYADYQAADPAALIREYPGFSDAILSLAPAPGRSHSASR